MPAKSSFAILLAALCVCACVKKQTVKCAWGLDFSKAMSKLDQRFDGTFGAHVIDKDGNWRLTLPFGIEPELMIEDIETLLKE